MRRAIKNFVYRGKKRYVKVLGIETSCDETGISIMDDNKRIISESLYTHETIVKEWGGVHPLHTSFSQLKVIDDIIEECLNNGEVKSIDQVDGIAVTLGPGLSQCLRVGLEKAVELCTKYQKPLIPVNHLEAHVLSATIENEVEFPFVSLLISGGHTMVILVRGIGQYELICQSLDDSIGETFDKTARVLGLPVVHGGKMVEQHSIGGENNFRFTIPLSRNERMKAAMFSFAGLKSAVLKVLKEQNLDFSNDSKDLTDPSKVKISKDIAYSFQYAATKHLCSKLSLSIENSFKLSKKKFNDLVIVGGVASNQYIRKEILKVCERYNLRMVVPSSKYCTDNGTMVAWTGVQRLILKDQINDFSNLDVRSRWPIDSIKEKNF